MLAKYSRAVVNQARGFMIMMGYIMALAAFFVTLAQLGDITPALKVTMWALLAVPIVYALAVTVESLTKNRETASD